MPPSRCAPLLLAALLTAGAAGQSLDQWGPYRFTLGPPRNSANETIESVPENATVSIHLLQSRNVVGEELEVEFRLTNNGATPFNFETGGDSRGGLPQRCIVEVRDSGGLALYDLSRRAPGATGGFVRLGSLGPGEASGQLLSLARSARIEEPGLYTVWIYHDFGWLVTADRPLPIASGTFELGLPSREEAAARVARLCAPPKSPADEARQRGQLRLLRHPVYLEALRAEVARGSILALTGVASIETRDAAEILIDALSSPQVAIEREASQLLRSAPDGIRHRARQGLDEGLFERVQAAADALLRKADAEACAAGAGLAAAFGNDFSASAVQSAIVRQVKDPSGWRGLGTLELPRPLRELCEAWQVLRTRGFRPAGAPTESEGALTVRLLALADPEGEKPEAEEWLKDVQAGLAASSLVTRRLALRAMPNPVVGEFLRPLRRALEDRDPGVQQLAAELAGTTGDLSFRRPMLQLMASKHDPWVVKAAAQAAATLGADQFALWEAWAERVADDDLGREAMLQLSRAFAEVSDRTAQLEFFSLEGATPEAREELRGAWRSFLRGQRSKLVAGERLPLKDARWRPLFGREKSVYYAFRLDEGGRWPRE